MIYFSSKIGKVLNFWPNLRVTALCFTSRLIFNKHHRPTHVDQKYRQEGQYRLPLVKLDTFSSTLSDRYWLWRHVLAHAKLCDLFFIIRNFKRFSNFHFELVSKVKQLSAKCTQDIRSPQPGLSAKCPRDWLVTFMECWTQFNCVYLTDLCSKLTHAQILQSAGCSTFDRNNHLHRAEPSASVYSYIKMPR